MGADGKSRSSGNQYFSQVCNLKFVCIPSLAASHISIFFFLFYIVYTGREACSSQCIRAKATRCKFFKNHIRRILILNYLKLQHIKDSFTSLRDSVPSLQGEKVVYTRSSVALLIFVTCVFYLGKSCTDFEESSRIHSIYATQEQLSSTGY